MILDKLQVASFREVQFLTPSGSNKEGRKTVTHEYVNSGTRFVEDLGPSIPKYKVTAIVHGVDALQRRDALRRVLKQPGVGTLVHPYYGRVEVTVEAEYEITHSDGDLGQFQFDITFAEAQETGVYPSPIAEQPSTILAADEAARAQANDLVERNWLPPLSATSRADSFTKLSDFRDTLRAAIAPLSGDLSGVISALDFFGLTPFDLSSGLAIATYIQNIYNAIAELDVDDRALFGALSSLFDFGRDDSPITNASGLSYDQRRRGFNRQLLNTCIRSSNLTSALSTASVVSYLTTTDIDEIRNALEGEFKGVVDLISATVESYDPTAIFSVGVFSSGAQINFGRTSALEVGPDSTSAVLNSLLDLVKLTRARANQLFDRVRTRAYFIEQHYNGGHLSVRLLNYFFYENQDLSSTLESLNNVTRPSALARDLQVLAR